MSRVRVGDRAPDFTLPDQNGNMVSLSDFADRLHVVLYFYPRDRSPGCSMEALAFRDNHELFKDAGARVIGISSDSIESHCEFASKRDLPFTLLSDLGGAVRQQYGVKPTLGIIPGRVSYVIDKRGVVRYIYSSQLMAQRHADRTLQILKTLD